MRTRGSHKPHVEKVCRSSIENESLKLVDTLELVSHLVFGCFWSFFMRVLYKTLMHMMKKVHKNLLFSLFAREAHIRLI